MQISKYLLVIALTAFASSQAALLGRDGAYNASPSATPSANNSSNSSGSSSGGSSSSGSDSGSSNGGGEGNATAADSITADQLKQGLGAPLDCPGDTSGECADAEKAADGFNKSFEKYKITNKGDQIALIALGAFETGVPGQGTRSMMSYGFVYEYAMSLHPEEVKKLGATGQESPDDPSKKEVMNKVLALVNKDNSESFGALAWYLVTKTKFHNKITTGDSQAFVKYIQEGVNTDGPARLPVWEKLNAVLNKK
ncbi:hypothetical protein EV182_003020 [Spiromyces aspiralis]|uniref:Uncharacterized protein n=1 Tax=Spiromyces aspiralis TaxID=68401 RepID=A0ACC1HG00_9FUNG|nr:hypothetical protein EV182_003020 [Spiromyces aspiralis]